MLKKISLYLVSILFVLSVASCATTFEDPYKAFRGHSATSLFRQAKHLLRKKDNHKAVKRLEALDALHPFNQYAKDAQLLLIYAYYRSEDIASALSAIKRYLRLYPDGQYTDYVYYLQGIVHMDEGSNWLQQSIGLDPTLRDLERFKKAFRAFSTLTTRYPKSLYTPMGRQYMISIRQSVARHYLEVAQYYDRLHQYQAVVLRTMEVIKHFQGTPAVVPALTLLHKAAHKLGRQALQRDVALIQKYNHLTDDRQRSIPPPSKRSTTS